jgi:Peptidase family C78
MRKPPYVSSLVKYLDEYFRVSGTQKDDVSSNSSSRITTRAPLYFQHAGHSRTIVGIEHLNNNKINFLVYDPSKRPSKAIKEFTADHGKSDSVLKPFRVSIDDIAKKKEYQILRYCTVRPPLINRLQDGMMDPVEIETRKTVHFIKMNQ